MHEVRLADSSEPAGKSLRPVNIFSSGLFSTHWNQKEVNRQLVFPKGETYDYRSG